VVLAAAAVEDLAGLAEEVSEVAELEEVGNPCIITYVFQKFKVISYRNN
jgi:hypothetical protein